jgi:hypothetical protein
MYKRNNSKQISGREKNHAEKILKLIAEENITFYHCIFSSAIRSWKCCVENLLIRRSPAVCMMAGSAANFGKGSRASVYLIEEGRMECTRCFRILEVGFMHIVVSYILCTHFSPLILITFSFPTTHCNSVMSMGSQEISESIFVASSSCSHIETASHQTFLNTGLSTSPL